MRWTALDSLELVVESDFTLHRDLISRDTALEKFVNSCTSCSSIKPKGFFDPKAGFSPSRTSRESATYSRYCRISFTDKPATPPESRSRRTESRIRLLPRASQRFHVPSVRRTIRDAVAGLSFTTSNGEFQMAALIAEDPVSARCQPMQQPA